MRQLFPLAAGIVSFFLFISPASATTVDDLERACNTPATDASYELNAGLCLGYITGVVDHEKLRSKGVVADGIFCLSYGVAGAELRAVVRRYLGSRSERDAELAATLVSNALASAFPCRKAG